MTRPVIGVTSSKQYFYQTEHFPGVPMSYGSQDILDAVAMTGGLPIIFPSFKKAHAKEYVSKVDGIVLGGGADVDPYLYGQEARPLLKHTDYERDLREVALFEEAVKQKKPILAICRGMQLVNVIFGGTLLQDLSYDKTLTVNHLHTASGTDPIHTLYVQENSHFASLVPDQTRVNSIHHQIIDKLGDPLTASAHTADGVIEAVEVLDDTYSIVGVQYHPEHMVAQDEKHLAVYTDLIERVKDSQG